MPSQLPNERWDIKLLNLLPFSSKPVWDSGEGAVLKARRLGVLDLS